MKSFNWRVLSPNTLRSYTQAARDFETVTGRPVQNADEVSLSIFRRSMEARRLSVSTIRQRLSAVAMLSGVKVELPRREPSAVSRQRAGLSAEQVRSVMAAVTDPSHRLLLVKLLTIGTKARQMDVTPDTFAAHLAGCNEADLSAQKASRMIKRYARKAGLNEDQVSLRVWCQTGRRLMERLSIMELVEVIGTPETSRGVEWKPLHGIGRRRRSMSV